MNTIKIVDDHTRKTSDILREVRGISGLFSWYSDTELDEQFAPTETTTRYFLDSQEPDKETLGKSVKEIGGDRMITLRERLLLDIEYFKKHGERLDVKGDTLCGGSRYHDGDVPSLSLDGYGRAYVYRCNPDYADDARGVRQAVSLEPSSSVSFEIDSVTINGIQYKRV